MGPLDAQSKLLENMLQMSYESVDISNAISVIESVSQVVYQHIVGQEKVMCRSNSESGVSARSCFGGLFANMLKSSDPKSVNGDASRDGLMCNLLRLVNVLVQISLPGRGSVNQTPPAPPPRRTPFSAQLSNQQARDAPADLSSVSSVEDSPISDSSKISQGLAGGTPRQATIPQSMPQSDDEKSIVTDEQKTENAASQMNSGNIANMRGRSCTHFVDVRNPDATSRQPSLSDIILGHPGIMRNFITALSCCNSNTMAMILSSSGLHGNMQDSFTGIDPLSVGDGIFQILCTLNKTTSDVKMILKPILEYLSSGFHGGRGVGISRLSEPLLWFILRVLDCDTMIKHCLSMGK